VNARAIEVKAYVPARDFALSRAFYRDLGFTERWSTEALACFARDGAAFLLQDFHVPEHAANFQMHLLVDDVDAWWQSIEASRLAERYLVRAEPPADRPWGMRDFVLFDPGGVLWRIGQTLSSPPA
jgi:catechol 2,3-dioxygenase-like lactoylglutathione lyase family enzyme